MRGREAEVILMVVGGVIPARDYKMLKAAGVAAIYGPGTNIPDAAREGGAGAEDAQGGVTVPHASTITD